MKRLAGTIARSALLGVAAIAAGTAQAQTTAPGAPQGSTTITNSPGATTSTTWNDNRVIIYQQAKSDPVTQQFVATLRNYNLYLAQGSQFWRAMRVHMFALDDAPASGGPGESATFYLIVAAEMDDDDAEHVEHCEVRPGVTALGFVGSIPTVPLAAGFKARVMGSEDAAMLGRVCAGLRAPLYASGGASAFDSLSGDSGYVAMLLFTGAFTGARLEADVFGDYWMRALASRYTRAPMLDAAAVMGLTERFEEFADGKAIDIPFPLPMTPAGPSADARRAREEFGGRVDRLVSDWSAYLAGAAITLREERKPLLTNGQFARLIPRYTRAEIGSRNFWLGADDLGSLIGQAECLKQHFLVDRGYVAPDTFQVPGMCALDEFRLPLR